jgi:hypothetical protein
MNRWTDEPAGSAVPSAYPAPSTRVMRLAELDPEALGARRVSPDERRRVIDERLQQVTRLQGLTCVRRPSCAGWPALGTEPPIAANTGWIIRL